MKLRIEPLPFPGFRRRIQVVARNGEHDALADALAVRSAQILSSHFAMRFPDIATDVVYHAEPA